MAMSEEKLKKLVEERAKTMTMQRYQEIEEGLRQFNLGVVELLAWIKIHEDLGKWGHNWQFAQKVTA